MGIDNHDIARHGYVEDKAASMVEAVGGQELFRRGEILGR